MSVDPRTPAELPAIVMPMLWDAWLKADPPCPTCDCKRDTWGETGLYDPCPDCADGVLPFDKWTAGLAADIERLRSENERLRVAILDIDAHATPLGEDDAGFVAVGYAVSVGSLHRALGVVGHSAPKGVTKVDMEPDFIEMLYDLVPQNAGLPLGAAALIWRAARELEAIRQIGGAR